MSEPDLTGSEELATDQAHLKLGPETRGADVPAEVATDVVGTDGLNQRERIEQLEQALEQSLASINELRLQLKDQHLLETQLAATEEMANLQQQVINELQRQLRQRSLEVEIAVKSRNQFSQKHQPLRVDLPAFLTKRQGHGGG